MFVTHPVDWSSFGLRAVDGQVMTLGVLKVVADKIPALLFELCGKGDARCGPKDETLVAANERIAHMGRLILATLAPPEYVDVGTPAIVWSGFPWFPASSNAFTSCLLSLRLWCSIISAEHVVNTAPTHLLLSHLVVVCLLGCRYFVRKGVIQPTYKGRQWRHGLVYWPFMVAGLIGPPDDDNDDATAAPAAAPPRRRRRSSTATGSGSSSASGSPTRSLIDRSGLTDGTDSPVPNSDHDTDDTNSEGDEAAAKGSVPNPLRKKNKEEYKRVFKGKAVHEAVLHVVCSLTRLMGKLCGDNMPVGAMRTEKEAAALQQEASTFVTDLVRVLFGAVNTTKMHRLAFHLLQELLLRGNLEEGDTSTNEMLHKLLKAMYRVTNKHPDNFQVQMMRCEQTLLHILTEAADERLREAERLEAAKRATAKKRRAPRKSTLSPPISSDRSKSVDLGSTSTEEDDETGHDGSDESDDPKNLHGSADKSEDNIEEHNLDDDVSSSGYATCSGTDGDDDESTNGELSTSGGSLVDRLTVTSDGTLFAGASGSSATCASATTTGSSTKSGLATASETATSSSSATASGLASATASEAGTTKRGCKRSATPLTADNMRRTKKIRTATGPDKAVFARRNRVRVRRRRVSVAAAAAADGGRLRRLLTLPGLCGAQMLTVGNSTSFHASFEWGAKGFWQRVRAARALYNGSPWWDYVRIRDPHNAAKTRFGLARLVIRAVDGEVRDVVVVQLLEEAAARSGCVLTDFGCVRYKWEMDPSTGFPSVALVQTADIQRLEHVVPDFEDLCDRLGLYATPLTVPDSPHELPLQRFFLNAVVPWTGGCEDDKM